MTRISDREVLWQFNELCNTWQGRTVDEIAFVESVDPMDLAPEQERRIGEMWELHA